MKSIIILSILILSIQQIKSFIPPRPISHFKLHLSDETSQSPASSPELANPHPQDLRLFLTQRTIQSFMFLLASTRDLHTVQWLDNFTKPVIVNNYWDEDKIRSSVVGVTGSEGVGDAFREGDRRLGSKLLNYHGLSALNTTIFPHWDSFFSALLDQPETTLQIQTPNDVGLRSYSSFDIDISPTRLCSRLLSVREQIASELKGDLKAISTMGQMIFDSYWYNKNNTETDVSKSDGKKGGIGYRDGSSPNGFDKPSMLYMNFDPLIDAPYAPSPLRKGNFDLLYNLITQTSIVDLLQNGVYVGENTLQNESSLRYLEQFYRERVVTHFVGAQFYWRGDDFLEEMMLSSPIVMYDDLNDGDGVEGEEEVLEIEPFRVAEQILLNRDKIALEWLEIMEGVPVEHTEIRRMQLARSMMGEESEKVVVHDEFQ